MGIDMVDWRMIFLLCNRWVGINRAGRSCNSARPFSFSGQSRIGGRCRPPREVARAGSNRSTRRLLLYRKGIGFQYQSANIIGIALGNDEAYTMESSNPLGYGLRNDHAP